jgi:hypothetical protein
MLFYLGSGVLSAAAFVVALQLHREKVFKRLVPWLMLIAGLGLAGALGKLLGLFAGLLERLSTTGTKAFFGIGIPWIVAVVMLIHLVLHMNPLKRGKGPDAPTPWVALLFPSVLAVSSGILAIFNGWTGDTFQQFGTISAQLFNDLTSGAR